jgi:hypothetical protein
MTWLYDLLSCVWLLALMGCLYSAKWEEDHHKRKRKRQPFCSSNENTRGGEGDDKGS